MNYSELFVNGLEERNREKLKMVPKADLHNHYNLGGNREYILEKSGIRIDPLKSKLQSFYDMDSWVQERLGPFFNNLSGKLILLEATFLQAKDDGVTKLEIGPDVWELQEYYDYRPNRVIDEFKSAHSNMAPEVEFIPQLGFSRHCPIDLLIKWFEPFLDFDYFKSVDLYCDEMAQPITNLKPLYRSAKRKGLRLKAHVGEIGSAESIIEAVEELELDEVQHGVSAASSKAVMKWLSDNKIQLNITPSSNIFLNVARSYAEHPIKVLYDNGVKVTINTDDLLVFGNTIIDEYFNLFDTGVFTALELDQIRRNSF